MNAYVKVRNGNFPDVNYYMAWKGFVELGYNVIKFEEEYIDALDIKSETPVFAGVNTTRTIIKKFFCTDYIGIDPYPDSLAPIFDRTIKKGPWGELKEDAYANKLFVKPVVQKQFQAKVMSSFVQNIQMINVKDADMVYVSTPVKFLSEFRVYVNDGEIVGVKHYNGQWDLIPQTQTFIEAIRMYSKQSPISYGMDIGVIRTPHGLRDILVEINDGICLGNYGLDTVLYAELLIARWIELTRNIMQL